MIIRARPYARLLTVFSGLPSAYWVLTLGTLINGIATFVLPYLTIYLITARGLPLTQAAFMVSLYGVGSCLAGLGGGILSDKIGRRPVMLAGMILLALTTLLLGFVQDVAIIAIIAFLYGFWNSLYRPACLATITDLVPQAEQVRANTIIYWAYNIGIAVSPLLASAVVRWTSYGVLFCTEAVGTLIFCALVYLFVAESCPAVTASLSTPSHQSPRQARREKGIFRDYPFLAFGILSVAVASLYFQSASAMPADMQLHGMALGQYGLAISVNGLAVVTLSLPLASLFTRWSPFRSLEVAAFFLGVGFSLMAVAGYTRSLLIYMLSVFTWTLGEIIYSPSAASVVAIVAPERQRGTYQGLFRMAWGLASFIGPSLGGLLLARYGAWMWVGCLVLGMLTGFGFHLIGVHHHRGVGKRLAVLRARYKYPVELNHHQRRFLEHLLKTPDNLLSQRRNAQILLLSDCGTGSLPHTTRQITAKLSVAERTVIRVRERFSTRGFEEMFITQASIRRTRPTRVLKKSAQDARAFPDVPEKQTNMLAPV